MGHHLVRHGGGLHAGPRHQRDQRGPPSPAGIALRRPRGSVLGPHLVPRRQRRHHPRHGLAGGAPPAQALLPHLCRPLHRQLLPIRHRAEPHLPHRGPHLPGHRGRADHSPLPGHPVGDLSPRAAGPRHGGVGHRLHDGPDHRAPPRRLHRRQLVVALDLLHQPARGLPRLFHGQRLPLRSALPAQARPRRLARPHPDGAGLRLPSAPPRSRRAGGLVRLPAHRVPRPAPVVFVIRELMAREPILDLRVFADRNFATGATFIALIGLGMFSSMLLLAVFTQKLLGYDAWTSGLVLAPGGFGNMLSLLLCGRLVTRTDQRLLLTFGCVVNAISLYMMSNLTLSVDYWTLAFPRFIQGFALGFIFVPLSTLTLSTIARDKLVNATS